MKVSILIGANAYAVIMTDTRSLDVLLAPGRSAAKSLRESAEEDRAKAERLLARAELLDQAAIILDNQ